MDNLSDSFPVSIASQTLVNLGASEWELGKERREPGRVGMLGAEPLT